MKKINEEKDAQKTQSSKEILDLKQTINDLRKINDKLENAYNEANELIEKLENQLVAKQNTQLTPNVIMANPLLAGFIHNHLLAMSANIVDLSLQNIQSKESSIKNNNNNNNNNNNSNSEFLAEAVSCSSLSCERLVNKSKQNKTGSKKNRSRNKAKRRNFDSARIQADDLKNDQNIPPKKVSSASNQVLGYFLRNFFYLNKLNSNYFSFKIILG